jgi:hypothetical protein
MTRGDGKLEDDRTDRPTADPREPAHGQRQPITHMGLNRVGAPPMLQIELH